MKKNKKPIIWGSAEYLVSRYDDIVKAVKSRKSKAAREFKALVKSLSTPKDNMYVAAVYAVDDRNCDGKVAKGHGAEVAFGLNGPGRQLDYIDALRRIVERGAFVFDAFIDACDDVGSVLVRLG